MWLVYPDHSHGRRTDEPVPATIAHRRATHSPIAPCRNTRRRARLHCSGPPNATAPLTPPLPVPLASDPHLRAAGGTARGGRRVREYTLSLHVVRRELGTVRLPHLRHLRTWGKARIARLPRDRRHGPRV